MIEESAARAIPLVLTKEFQTIGEVIAHLETESRISSQTVIAQNYSLEALLRDLHKLKQAYDTVSQ